jgi:hypothetical protein
VGVGKLPASGEALWADPLALHSLKNRQTYFPIVLFFYFALAQVYVFFLRREAADCDSLLAKTVARSGAASTGALILCIIGMLWKSQLSPGVMTALYLSADLIALAAVLNWSAYNLKCVSGTMRDQ